MKYRSKGPADTKKIAKIILSEHPEIRIILLYGNLASGKTTFAKGVAEALGIAAKEIKSPTFAFIREHPGLYHYDLYRLEAPDQSIAEILNEHLESNATVLIEWPETVEKQIHRPHLKVRFRHLGGDEREIELEG